MVNKDKKFIINEGRAITNGKFAYGGFPRILSEENNGATDRFQDSPDQGQKNVATQPNDAEEPITWEFEDKAWRYPSKSFMEVFQKASVAEDAMAKAWREAKDKFGPIHAEKQFVGTPQHIAMLKELEDARKAVRAHPHHAEFQRGHPSTRRGPMTPEERSDFIMGRNPITHRARGDWTGD